MTDYQMIGALGTLAQCLDDDDLPVMSALALEIAIRFGEKYDQIAELTKQRDGLLAVCRDLEQHAEPHLSAWEFNPWDLCVDGKDLHKRMQAAIALCPKPKEGPTA